MLVINKDSKDKDCSGLRNFYVAIDGVVIDPPGMKGKTVEEVESQRTREAVTNA